MVHLDFGQFTKQLEMEKEGNKRCFVTIGSNKDGACAFYENGTLAQAVQCLKLEKGREQETDFSNWDIMVTIH